MENLHFNISGMDYADCATGIEKALKQLN